MPAGVPASVPKARVSGRRVARPLRLVVVAPAGASDVLRHRPRSARQEDEHHAEDPLVEDEQDHGDDTEHGRRDAQLSNGQEGSQSSPADCADSIRRPSTGAGYSGSATAPRPSRGLQGPARRRRNRRGGRRYPRMTEEHPPSRIRSALLPLATGRSTARSTRRGGPSPTPRAPIGKPVGRSEWRSPFLWPRAAASTPRSHDVSPEGPPPPKPVPRRRRSGHRRSTSLWFPGSSASC
jgi:hypothetical protein